jgi:hypothetical protein
MSKTAQHDIAVALSSCRLKRRKRPASRNQTCLGLSVVCQNPEISAAQIHKVLTKLFSYSNNIAGTGIEGGRDGNSLLHEVQEEEGNEQPSAGNAQESEAGHPGCLSCVRH